MTKFGHNFVVNLKSYSDIISAFHDYCQLVEDKPLRGACYNLESYQDFWIWAGGQTHHCYRNGLIIHTMEVVENCLTVAKQYQGVCNTDILITAALWHDLAKIWDIELKKGYFSKIETWAKTDYHGKVHHISGSLAEFTHAAKTNGVNISDIQKVQHCIISHHGFNKGFGSPRIPESLEAIILHQADMLGSVYSRYTKI